MRWHRCRSRSLDGARMTRFWVCLRVQAVGRDGGDDGGAGTPCRLVGKVRYFFSDFFSSVEESTMMTASGRCSHSLQESGQTTTKFWTAFYTVPAWEAPGQPRCTCSMFQLSPMARTRPALSVATRGSAIVLCSSTTDVTKRSCSSLIASTSSKQAHHLPVGILAG